MGKVLPPGDQVGFGRERKGNAIAQRWQNDNVQNGVGCQAGGVSVVNGCSPTTRGPGGDV